ncbi:MAG: aminotransferase class IV, partial [Novosphingobium sp.]
MTTDQLTKVLFGKRRSGVTISATPLPETRAISEFRFIIAPERVETGNRYLYHKTTRRDFYDEPRKRAHDASGVDEVVFLNERGELTEGSFTNLFVEKDGVLSTPPVSAGSRRMTPRPALSPTSVPMRRK